VQNLLVVYLRSAVSTVGAELYCYSW